MQVNMLGIALRMIWAAEVGVLILGISGCAPSSGLTKDASDGGSTGQGDGPSFEVPDVPTDNRVDSPASDDVVDGQEARSDVDAEPPDSEPANDAEGGVSACGGENQPCCPYGMPECISSGLACAQIGDVCRPCGGTGQPCCTGQVCNVPTDGCGGFGYICSHCGGQGEPCCGSGGLATRTCDLGTCHMTTDTGAQCGT
jgi:hypothetical protein